jgi:tetratricopeptide (TPR) repeat protein
MARAVPTTGPNLAVRVPVPAAAAAPVPAAPEVPPAPAAAGASWADAAQRFVATTQGKVAVGVVVAAAVAVGAYALYKGGSDSSSSSSRAATKPAAAAKRTETAPRTPKKEAGASAPVPAPAPAPAVNAVPSAAPAPRAPIADEKREDGEAPLTREVVCAHSGRGAAAGACVTDGQRCGGAVRRQERARRAKEAKQAGNKLFENRQYEKALELYTEAITLAPPEDAKDLAVYYANRAACYNNLVRTHTHTHAPPLCV